MPAILKPDELEQMRKAGSAPRVPAEDPKLKALSQQIADLSASLEHLTRSQVDAVIQSAGAAHMQVAELARALKSTIHTDSAQPPAKERWRFVVDKRDASGRIVSLTAEQIE